GSIAHYVPQVAVVNNIALDHKSLPELRRLFGDFIGKSTLAVLNIDNEETAVFAAGMPADRKTTYSLESAKADLLASDISLRPGGVASRAPAGGTTTSVPVGLAVPGRHNVANALAALAAVSACGVTLESAAAQLASFTGLRRRLELVGVAAGVSVIDDFA